MKTIRLGVAIIAASTALAACAQPLSPAEITAKLRQMTLKATGAAASETPTVTDQKQTGARWVWKASVGSKAYNCDSDTFFELPACEPVAQP